MSIRYLIAAAFLFGSACGAQADVLRGAGQSGLLTSWNGKGVHAAAASSYVAPAASTGGVVDGAPSPDWNTHGNGATVITPAEGGQSGGAIVTLPPQANGGKGPVSAPSAQEPAAAVPEPSSIALMMAGMMGALGIARRRKR